MGAETSKLKLVRARSESDIEEKFRPGLGYHGSTAPPPAPRGSVVVTSWVTLKKARATRSEREISSESENWGRLQKRLSCLNVVYVCVRDGYMCERGMDFACASVRACGYCSRRRRGAARALRRRARPHHQSQVHPSPLPLPLTRRASVAAASAAHETRDGARSPPPSPNPSGASVATAPAAHETRDNVSFSCPDHGFGIDRWVVTSWVSNGPARPTLSDPWAAPEGA